MSYYDPSSGQWYANQGQIPQGTTVYDNTSGQWVKSSTAPVEGVPTGYGQNPETGGWGPTTSTAYLPGQLLPTETPANAPANIGRFVDPTQTDAQSLAAQLLQSEFGEWEKYFKPIEEAQMQQLSFVNPTVLPTALKEATKSATGASEAAKGILQRQTQSQGINPTAQQTAASNRILNLGEAANTASARNTARRQIQEQDTQILLGAAPNYSVVRQALNPVQ